MSSRRTLILIAAVLVGAIAAVALFNYIGGVEARAGEGAREVEVLVLKKDVARGMSGQQAVDEQFIVRDQIAAKFRPATAITDPSVIQSFVAVTDLPAGSVLVANMFVTKEQANTGNAELLEGGNVAISISVDQVRGVAGLIVPGDFVNVLVIPVGDTTPSCAVGIARGVNTVVADGAQVPDGATAVTCNTARYLFQKVQVLFVDQTTVPQPGQNAGDGSDGETLNAGLITLAVPAAAAQLLATVAPESIYLTLVAPDYAPVPLPALDPFPALLPGEDPARLTPYGPQGLQDQ